MPFSTVDPSAAPRGMALASRLLQTMPWGVLVLTRTGQMTLMNSVAHHWLGSSGEPVLGRKLDDALPRSCPPEIRAALHQAAVARHPVTGRFYLPLHQQWISMTTEPGEAEVLVYWQDESEYQVVADNLPDVITRWDTDLRLSYANAALAAETGRPLTELLGKTVAEMGAAASLTQAFNDQLRQALATGLPLDHTYALPLPTGMRYFHARLVPEWQQDAVFQVVAIARDITDLTTAEMERRASTQLLEAAEEVAHTGSYEADLATMTFRFSDGMFRLFGEVPQSFVPTLDFIDARSYPGDAAAVKAVLDEAVLSRQPYYYTRRIYRADGALRLLESHGRVVCDADGQPLRLLGLVQDVTERKQAEDDLARATHTIQRMLDGSPAAICQLDARRDERTNTIVDFTFRGVNHASEMLNQKTAPELLGRGLLEHFPELRDTIFEDCVRVVETGQSLRAERRHASGGHREQWLDVSAVKNEDGVILTFLDITARKEAEQEQVAHQQLLQAIFNATLNSLEVFRSVLNDAGEVMDFEWVLANETALRRVQRPHLAGQRLLAGAPYTQATAVFSHLRQVVLEQRARDFELCLPRDGGEAWYHVAAAPFREGVVVTWQDITESKRAAATELRQHQHLVKTVLAAQEAERQRIAESLHNGLNQVLYAAKLHLEQLTVPAPVPPTFARDKARVKQLLGEAIAQGRTLSHQLMPTVLEDYGLSTAINSICHALSSRQLHFRCSLAGYKSANKVLELALYRIAQELANNIVKHAHATEANLSLAEKDGWLELQADDNGQGFDPAAVHGRGMGLQAMQDRVQLLGGQVVIRSSPHHGTHICVLVPHNTLGEAPGVPAMA